MLVINKTVENAEAVFKLEGRLDTASAPSLEKELVSSLDGVRSLILDFEKVEYVSSAGLRVLLATFKRMRSANGSMSLINVGKGLSDVFQLTGLARIFGL